MCLRHRWDLIEAIGNVYSYRCRNCPKTKTSVTQGQTPRTPRKRRG